MDTAQVNTTDGRKWIATPTAAVIMDALSIAQQQRELGVIFGGAGLGKTRTMQHYATLNRNVCIAVMSPTRATTAAALERACRAAGLREPPGVGANRLQDALEGQLSETGGLLIIDEAQHLSVAALETFRSIYDATDVGLVLAGNQMVYNRLAGGRRTAEFAQLFSRVGVRVPLTRASDADVEAIAAAWGVTGKEELTLLRHIAQSHGALRVVCKALSAAKLAADGEGAALTAEMIKGAWLHLGGEA